MTKEELVKEAEEYALNTYEMCSYSDLPYASDRRAREQAFIAGAESREKRIAELEDEARAKENCWNCAYFKEKKYQACIDIKKNKTIRCAFYKWDGKRG